MNAEPITAQADEPTAQPVSTKTRIILQAIERLDTRLMDLQNVSEAVKEIQKVLRVNNTWQSAIIRALKHFVSLIELTANGRRSGRDQ